MHKIRKRILALLYPDHARCLGCGDLGGTEEEGWLCDKCMQKVEELDLLDRPRCPRCGRPRVEAGPCPECADWPDDAVSAAAYRYGYAPPLDEAVRQMKYRGVYRMAEWMGDDVAELIFHDGFNDCDMLVPVPMHPRRLRERGRNQARSIAEAVSLKTGTVLVDALARVVNTREQARLNGETRRRSLREAIAPAAGVNVRGKKLLLIDDVITTGATINACAAALYAAGAADVRAAAFAGHLPRLARR